MTRLLAFRAVGFKNLVDVRLNELGDVNIIHGESGVGKSNLLSAIHAFLSLCSTVHPFTPESPRVALAAALQTTALSWFEVGGGGSILLEGTLGGGSGKGSIGYRLERASDGVFVTRMGPAIDERPIHFGHIPAEGEDPQGLATALYPSQDALSAVEREAFLEFIERTKQLSPLFAAATIRARLQAPPFVVEHGTHAVPLSTAGSGVQHLVLLAASLTVHRESILTLEEPERRLPWLVQRKLGGVLSEYTETRPAQVFLSTHSDAFEVNGSLRHFLLVATDTGPVARGLASEGEVTEALGIPTREGPQTPNGRCRVTPDGVVKLPLSALERLGITGVGGPVVCIDGAQPHGVEMLRLSDWEDLVE